MRGLCVLFALLAGCDGGGTASRFSMRMIGPDGADVIAPIESGTLSVRVRQSDRLIACGGDPCEAEIRDGDVSLDVSLESFDELTQAHAEITGDAVLIGATPAFQPYGEGIDVVHQVLIVMSEAPQCRTIGLEGIVHAEIPRLSPGRAHAAALVRRSLVLIAGGEGEDEIEQVDRFDQLTFDGDTLPTWNEGEIGPARGIAFSEDRQLAVGDLSSWLFELQMNGPPVARAISLHAGAGSRSALVGLDSDGAAVIAGEASSEITWVLVNGTPDVSTSLAVARTAPAAALVAGGIAVIGGHAEGEAGLELVPRRGNGVAQPGDLPRGTGGHLFASPDGSAAIWIGFALADGSPSADTFVIRDCADTCTIEPGPRWEGARTDATFVETSAGDLWIMGGDQAGTPTNLVDLVRWEVGQPSIEPGPMLTAARSGAVGFEHASGIVTIGGGRGTDVAYLDDFELCFPPSLDPLLP
jgi:hypothetical protein